jgi:hypothetical protein
MFVESIVFKRKKDSDWERGYYVGDTDNSEKSVILDMNYNPLEKDEENCSVWDYHTDTTNWIQLRCNER